ncbi:MAG: nitroreductase family protein [Methanomassiliicoccus sp.]|nr:nitroreductase family protein [Methanomassiliicoccus sp.]
MSEELYEAMFVRKSVRKFDREKLDVATMDRVVAFTATMRPLFPDIRTELRLMGPEEVKGIFKVDAPHYLAVFSEKKPGFEANAGFLLQQADLFLSAIGLGSCWQGGPRPVRGMRQLSGLDFVIMLAFGPPREVTRRDRSGFKRRSLSEITDITDHFEVLEAARIAPSGMNNQSWYFTGGDGTIHAYAARSAVTDGMNRINVGIALAHMWLAADHEGMTASFSVQPDGGESTPRGYAYIASMTLEHQRP